MAINSLFGTSVQASSLFKWLTSSSAVNSSTPLAFAGPLIVGSNASSGAQDPSVALGSNNTTSQVWQLPSVSGLSSLSTDGAIAFNADVGQSSYATRDLAFGQIAQTLSSSGTVTVGNTTAETTLRSLSIGNVTTYGRVHRWTEQILINNFLTSALGVTIRFYVGSSQLAVGFFNAPASTSTVLTLNVYVHVIMGSSGYFRMDSILIEGAAFNTLITSPTIQQGHNEASINTTGGYTLQSTAQLGTASTSANLYSLSWLFHSSG